MEIKVTENGPYLVQGAPPVRRRIVRGEEGRPETWQTTARLEAGESYALCRCGRSANKPFCDGSHAGAGFDGAEAAVADGREILGGIGITVSDDRSLCVHAGFCANRATHVWAMVEETGDSVVRTQLMAMVEHCPSGALAFSLEPGGPDVEPELPEQVAVVADGPLWVTGGARITRADGSSLTPRNRVTLCRCGASANKPLCDGSHRDVGFTDA